MKFKIDIVESGDISEEARGIIENIRGDLNLAVKALGRGAEAQARLLADQNMSSSLSDIYKKNLYIEEIADNIVEVGIKEGAFWIEHGKKGGFMEELLNHKSGKPPKVSKEGHKYRVIPMSHSTSSKGASSGSGDAMVNELKTFMKKQGVRYSKNRALATDSILSRNLQGLSVFQNVNPKSGKVERSIMTFRVISEKHRNSGKWQYPAGKPKKEILKDVYRWIEHTWQSQIFPELKNKYEKK
jgi:hypothetical protein